MFILNNPSAEFNYFSDKVDEKLIVNRGDLLFSWSGSKGTSFGPHIWDRDTGILNQHIFKVEHEQTINRRFFYYMLKEAVYEVEQNLHGGVGLVHITKGNLQRIKIPLPPLAIQEKIVAELDGYQKIIDGARQVVENYKPQIKIDPSWEMVELGTVCDLMTGGTPNSTVKKYYEGGNIKWLVSGDIHQREIYDCPNRITEEGMNKSNAKYLPVNSVLIASNIGIKNHG